MPYCCPRSVKWDVILYMLTQCHYCKIAKKQQGNIVYFQVCRNINRIKVCMETGQTVILLNLENLYESLYDALNQVCFELFV